MQAPPNILFIFADQHRHDVMGCAGHDIVSTPNLDRLANQGVRFIEAWCQSPICQPSRASVITGRYAHELGVIHNTGGFDPDWPTVMKQLQSTGYETATIGKTHYHESYQPPEEEGEVDMQSYAPFVRSFGWDYVLEEYDKYLHVEDRLRTPYTDYLAQYGLLDAYKNQIRGVFRLTDTHWRGETSVLTQEQDLTSFLASKAEDWLRQRDNTKPFFLKLAFVQPHVPLIDDPEWTEYYATAPISVPEQTPAEPVNETWAAYLTRLDDHSQAQVMDEDFIRNGIRHYLGMVSLVDQKIGKVITSLQALGQLDNTWIIYTGDHGEMLGEHHLWAKMNFYRGSVQVPLIIVPPGGIRPRVEKDLVELTDVTATLADIGNVQAPTGCHGRSLLPALTGQLDGREILHSRIGNYAAIRTARHRFTAHLKTETACELFDLNNDPHERSNLVNDPGADALISDLRATLLDHESGSEKSSSSLKIR